MSRRLNSLILSSLLSVSAYGIGSAGPLYTVDYNTGLYAIDPQTGNYSTFTPSLPANMYIEDVEVLNSSTLYLLTYNVNNNGYGIYSFMPQTNTTQAVVPSLLINADIYGYTLADSTTAYAVDYMMNEVYRINLQTGATTVIATIPSIPTSPGLIDIAVGNNNQGYIAAYNSDQVFAIDLETGAYRLVTTIPSGAGFEGIALLNNTTAVVVGNQDSTVYLVDLTTGALTPVATIASGPALASANLLNNNIAVTVNNVGVEVYAIDLSNGTYYTLTNISSVSNLNGVAILQQIGTNSITGNNLNLVNYLNESAPLQTIRLFALLTDPQLPPALQAAAPTRNAFATFAAQNGFLASSQVVADHSRQKRFHLRHPSPGKKGKQHLGYEYHPEQSADLASNVIAAAPVPVAEIPVEDLTADASCKIQKRAPCKKQAPFKPEPFTGWIAPFGEYAHEKSQHQTPAFNLGLGGVVAGFDFNNVWPHVVGIGGAYVFTRVDEKNDAGHANVNQGFLTVYGTLNDHKWYFDVGIWAGYYHIDNYRKISFPMFKATARSETSGWQLAPHFEVGYDGFRLHDNDIKWFGLEPFIMADYVATWEKGFREHRAGMLNMGQKGRFSSLFRGETGLRIHETATCSWGRLVFTEKASYAYQKAFKTGRINAFLVGSPGSFTVSTLGTAQNLGVGEFSMLFIFGSQNSTYLDLRYQGEFGSRYQSHQGVLELGKDF